VSGRLRLAIALALFTVTWAIYRQSVVSEGYNLSDPLLIVPTSLSLLDDGDLDLGEFAAAIDPRFYGLLVIDGRPYNRYPIGASLVILPLVWLTDGSPGDGEARMAQALRIAAACAKILAALSVALLFAFLAALTSPGRALALALVFAFATAHYPIHAGGLWTHNVVIPLVLTALLLLVTHEGRYAWSAAFPLALAFATRPTVTPMIAVLTVHVARRLPAALPRFALTGASLALLYVAWSFHMYGAPIPPYYLETAPGYHRGQAFLGEPLIGHLVSPNRGLFVFMPVLAFSIWGMVRAFRSEGEHAALWRTLAVIVIAHWVVVSVMARGWWGGWAFGPRHLMEVVPLLVVLLVPALEGFALLRQRVRLLLAPLVAATLWWSLFVAVHGANSVAPHTWNSTPNSIDEHPERVWDWKDMQILRGAMLR
jgi:hypothetical protein